MGFIKTIIKLKSIAREFAVCHRMEFHEDGGVAGPFSLKSKENPVCEMVIWSKSAFLFVDTHLDYEVKPTLRNLRLINRLNVALPNVRLVIGKRLKFTMSVNLRELTSEDELEPFFVSGLDWMRSHSDILVAFFLGNATEDVAYHEIVGDTDESSAVNSSSYIEIRHKTKDCEPDPGDVMTISLPGGGAMTFCWCPATTSEAWMKISGGKDYFLMGSPESELGHRTSETQHRVVLTKGFWMGQFPVTQEQWKSVMGSADVRPDLINPSVNKAGGDWPVENVSWNDCQTFISRINAISGYQVLLPTEAQWEYACRAGTDTPFSFGASLNGEKANCDGKCPYGTTVEGPYLERTSRVGTYDPNGWNIYDMHGNVCEWCEDYLSSRFCKNDVTCVDPCLISRFFHALRGGNWFCTAMNCRSAKRHHEWSGASWGGAGFRLIWPAEPYR